MAFNDYFGFETQIGVPGSVEVAEFDGEVEHFPGETKIVGLIINPVTLKMTASEARDLADYLRAAAFVIDGVA